MNGINYYALGENEEVPYEFVVIRNVNGEPEFCASFVNTNSLAYGNGVLLKFHERNDELRAENAKLHKLVADMWHELHAEEGSAQRRMALADRMRKLGIEVTE